MTLEQILQILNGKEVYLPNEEALAQDFAFVSATDLMSDALAMVKTQEDRTILVTGLVNAQAFRTAQMLDITNIIFVRDKQPSERDLAVAEELGCNVFSSPLSMYEACGRLYEAGLRTATR
ncbi:MAG: hypothetical protein LBR25_07985 [Erysipelotrichaceae bacterium]|jgi:hypothetical protein|nr:hypothetical protein [Erysipelotrichaceae bacterium]